MIFNRSYEDISSRQDRIVFRFKTANQNGSILESGLGYDYLVIELYRGFLLVRWNLGSGEIYVHVRDKACDDDKWHSVDITRNQVQLDLTLDGVLHVSRRFPGRFISFDLKKSEGDVFIGGMLTNTFTSKTRSSGASFDGCLQEINFNGVDIVQGVANGEGVFITKGRPRLTCEILNDPDPTTAMSVASSPPLVTTDKTTAEQSTTAVTSSTEKEELPTSYITTPMTTSDDYTYSSQQVLTPHAQSFSGNSVIPCVDDEDDCDSEDSGSGSDEDASGTNRQSSGDKGTSSSSSKENNVKMPDIIDNSSVKKPLKPFPSKDPLLETDNGLIGEPDISQTNCIQDDEDGCDSEDESGQSSTEIGSGESALPTAAPSTINDGGISYAKKTVRVRKGSAKKWALIAGIIVVGTLLVAFCIFAIWWLYKHKNDPYWNGSYKGSKERCLQSEVTEV